MRTLKTTLAILITAVTLSACGPTSSHPSSREAGAKTQESLMQRAQTTVPVPQVSNFLTRSAVAKWMQRMDKPNKLFYVYIMGDNGNIVGYYTAQNRPTSSCTLMTPPDRPVIHRDIDGDSMTTVAAPALDGVYYGSAQCAGVFFFDAATDAYIEVNGFHYVVTDQPLKVKADAIKVAS